MQTSDRASFLQIITALAATFRTPAEPALVEGYWMALSDMSLEDIKAAAVRSMRDGDFFPRPAELRRMAGGESAGEKSAEAWAKVLILARNSRAAQHPDPIAEDVVRRLGGWIRLGQLDADKIDWVRKDFVDLYETALNHAPALIGAVAREELGDGNGG